MNHTLKFTRQFSDGGIDHSNPHAPGFRFLDVNDASCIAAVDAYEARRAGMDYRNKRRQQAEDDKTKTETKTEKATLSADKARALADAAWEERTKRMQSA